MLHGTSRSVPGTSWHVPCSPPNWGGSCSWPQCSALAGDVPPEPVRLAMESVEFASEFVGFGDFAGYRAWRETAPALLAEIVDGVPWDVAKGGS